MGVLPIAGLVPCHRAIYSALHVDLGSSPKQEQGNRQSQDCPGIDAQVNHRLLKAVRSELVAGHAHLGPDGQDAARGADRCNEQEWPEGSATLRR